MKDQPINLLLLTPRERKDLIELSGRPEETKRAIEIIDILSDKVTNLTNILTLARWMCEEISKREQLIKPDEFLKILNGDVTVP